MAFLYVKKKVYGGGIVLFHQFRTILLLSGEQDICSANGDFSLCLSVSYLHEGAALGASSVPINSSVARTIPRPGPLQDQRNEYNQLLHTIKEDVTAQVWIILY